MKSLADMLAVIPIYGKGEGGKYCNAIDEDPFDPADWANRMPASGYRFNKNPDNSFDVVYEHNFACYDGWDSLESEIGRWPSYEEAVNAVYWMVTEQRRNERIYRNLTKYIHRSLNTDLKYFSNGYSFAFRVFWLERKTMETHGRW